MIAFNDLMRLMRFMIIRVTVRSRFNAADRVCSLILKKSKAHHIVISKIMHLKAIHTSNLGEKPLNPIQLLNALAETSLMVIFPNCCVALRIYCTLPVTVAEAERSFSVLKRIKNYLRSTMWQMRLTS